MVDDKYKYLKYISTSMSYNNYSIQKLLGYIFTNNACFIRNFIDYFINTRVHIHLSSQSGVQAINILEFSQCKLLYIIMTILSLLTLSYFRT